MFSLSLAASDSGRISGSTSSHSSYLGFQVLHPWNRRVKLISAFGGERSERIEVQPRQKLATPTRKGGRTRPREDGHCGRKLLSSTLHQVKTQFPFEKRERERRAEADKRAKAKRGKGSREGKGERRRFLFQPSRRAFL